MPVTIGARKQSGFDDPVGLMFDCHRRIESFLAALVNAAGLRALGNSEREALERALDYFRDAAPKHTEDEEKSVFPQLHRVCPPEELAIIAPLEHDHIEAAALHAELDRLGREWLAAGVLDDAQRSRFAEIARQLQSIYREHIRLEDTQLFPIARRMLDAGAQRAIGQEMAARRDRLVRL